METPWINPFENGVMMINVNGACCSWCCDALEIVFVLNKTCTVVLVTICTDVSLSDIGTPCTGFRQEITYISRNIYSICWQNVVIKVHNRTTDAVEKDKHKPITLSIENRFWLRRTFVARYIKVASVIDNQYRYWMIDPETVVERNMRSWYIY